MGWLKVTIEFVLKASQLDFAQVLGYDTPQKPLTPPKHQSPLLPTAPDVFTPSIVCEYPELEAQGWELCNSETSRDCWIRDPSAPQPLYSQFDVRTNCKGNATINETLR
jgi:hypothetical protein